MSEPQQCARTPQPGNRTGQAIARADGSRPRVLLAEDSMAARVLTAALLNKMGCDVCAVEHGEDAVHKARDRTYDIVLMDIEMPVMDGLTAAQEIRSMGGAAARMPIIALSAFIADSQRASSWQDSFDASLPKPAGREQLRDVIEQVLSAGPAELRSAGHEASREACGAIDRDLILDLKSQLTASQFITLLSMASEDLEEALDRLGCATGERDHASAQRIAHKVRGIAGSFAAPQLAHAASRFEDELKLAPQTALDTLAAPFKASLEATARAMRDIAADPEGRAA